MSDPLTDLINDVQHNGIRWVTLITLFGLYRKERRNTLLNRRDAANFHNQREIMIAQGVGEKWKDGPHLGFNHTDLPNFGRFFLLSQVVTILRRKQIMNKLKSRKLWLTVVAALIPVINKEFNINLDLGSIISIMTAIMAGVAALAHVDAKRVLAGIIHTKITPKGIEVAFTTFQEAIPYLKEIHTDINKLLEDVKKDDGSQAWTDAMQTYAQIKPILDALKHPEPVATILGDQVAS